MHGEKDKLVEVAIQKLQETQDLVDDELSFHKQSKDQLVNRLDCFRQEAEQCHAVISVKMEYLSQQFADTIAKAKKTGEVSMTSTAQLIEAYSAVMSETQTFYSALSADLEQSKVRATLQTLSHE